MTEVPLSQMVLDPAVRQKACAFLHQLGRGLLVDMHELEIAIAHVQTLADVLSVITVMVESAPLLQQAMLVQQPDGQRVVMRFVNPTYHYEVEEAGDSVVVSSLTIGFMLVHPMLQQPAGLAAVTINRVGSEMRSLGGILTDVHEPKNVIDNSLFEDARRKQLGPVYGYIAEVLYRMAKAIDFANGSVADGMRNQLLEKTGFIDTLDLMVNANLLKPLENLFKLVDRTLNQAGSPDGLEAAYAALRKKHGRIICGYDIVGLFNGRRHELSLPRLASRNRRELDVCGLHVALARHEEHPVDTVHVVVDASGKIVLSHALVTLRGGDATDTQVSALGEKGEEHMTLLEQRYPDIVVLAHRERLVAALKAFAPYVRKRPDAEELRRDLLRRLINPATAS